MTQSMNPQAVVSAVADLIAASVHATEKDQYLDVAEDIVNLVRAEVSAELNTLADARRQYGGEGTPFEDAIAREVQTARLLAKIIGREHDALGWLPSWAVPSYAKKHNPNGTEVFVR